MTTYGTFERQNVRSKGRPWVLIIVFLLFNWFAIFLIIDIDNQYFQIFTYSILGIGLFLLILKLLRGVILGKKTNSFSDIFPLTQKYFRINRRYLLVSIIGLIIAIAVISQIILLTSAPDANIYEEALEGGTVPVFTLSQYNWDQPERMKDFQENHENFQKKFTELASRYGLEGTRISYKYNFDMRLYYYMGNSEDQHSTYIRGTSITEEDFIQLQNFPSFPSSFEYSASLSILTIDEEIIQYEFPNETIIENYNQFTYSKGTWDESTPEQFSLDLDGWWKITQQDYRYAEANNLWHIIDDMWFSVVFANEAFPSVLEEKGVSYDYHLMYGYIDVESLKGMETDEASRIMENMAAEMYFYANSLGYGQIDYYSEASWRIFDAAFIDAGLRIILLIISIPMLVVAMYLVYFSLSLVELRKQNIVSIMKIRGISTEQLQLIMILESVLGALIASLIAMVLSIPWSQFVLNSTAIYGGNTELFIPSDWYWKIPTIGTILALDLNIFSIFSISKTKIEEGELAEEYKPPFWQRFYLDVISTVVGLIVWLSLRFVSVEYDIYYFLLFAAVWTLPLLILGIPLLISRYYGNFLGLISDFLWRREGNLFALATRNMRRNRYSASKLAVLLILGMMFSFVALGVPSSMIQWGEETSYYDVGADISILNVDSSNATYFNTIEKVTGIEAYTPVRHEQQTNVWQLTTSYSQVSILGIDPSSFANVAFWNDHYSSSSLQTLMDHLLQGKILVESTAIEVLDWEIGENVTVAHPSSRINAQLGGSFEYWPTLVGYNWFSSSTIDRVFLVMGMAMFQSYFNKTETAVFARINESFNHTLVKENLEASFQNFTSVDGIGQPVVLSGADSYTEFILQEQTILLFEMLDNLLIVTIITSIIAVGYFSFTSLSERKREIGVFRAVGMVSRQIFLLLTVESAILVLSSILMGILAGSFIASNIFLLLGETFGGSIPPIRLIYPVQTTVIFVLVCIVFSIIASAIPSRQTSKVQTGSILRAE